MVYTQSYASPLGRLLLTADGDGLTGLWFENQTSDIPMQESREEETTALTAAKHWLDRYFSGTRPECTPPLHLIGTPFRLAVWELLLKISYGQTTTYGAIAKELSERRGGARMSAQAVGGAVGHNPISIVIPCHRVVGSSGSLTGYAGGMGKKLWLLEHEHIDVSGLYITQRIKK